MGCARLFDGYRQAGRRAWCIGGEPATPELSNRAHCRFVERAGRHLHADGLTPGLLIRSPSMRTSYFTLAFACAVTLVGAPMDQKDIEYGRPDGKPLLLDLHVPDGPGPFPAAILVHGGGFDEGSKSTNVRPLFDVLASAGFAWFSIDYRLAPEFRFPQAIADVNSVIRWVKAGAAMYRVDVSKIALIGESAGGFLVNDAGTHETPDTKVAAVPYR
jgi:acetyl esterase/lipase